MHRTTALRCFASTALLAPREVGRVGRVLGVAQVGAHLVVVLHALLVQADNVAWRAALQAAVRSPA